MSPGRPLKVTSRTCCQAAADADCSANGTHGKGRVALAEDTVTLVHGQWAQESRPFAGNARQYAMGRGFARVTVQSGAWGIAFALVMDNLANDPTTIGMLRWQQAGRVWNRPSAAWTSTGRPWDRRNPPCGQKGRKP